MEKNYKVTY